jgi:diaminopimelate decarboxylase
MFGYEDGVLCCEDVQLADIAAAVGTPAYVYSTAELLQRAALYREAVGEDGLVCFAVKANGNPALLRLLRKAGLGADVTSGGELFLALHAGIAPQRIIFSGVGKRRDEIEMAVQAGIASLNIESQMELAVTAETAAALQRVVPVSVRVNPDIGAATHPYDSTGRSTHKFGVPRETAVAMMRRAAADPWLKPYGLAAHIGSQITDLPPYEALAAFLLDLAAELAAGGIQLESIDAGGGLGIDYHDDDVPSITRWVRAVVEPLRAGGYHCVIEPGRSIVGPAGALLTRVLYTKAQGGKQFAICDAGQNDLIRPALYSAYHPILPVRRPVRDAQLAAVDIVGPVCETGDFLARERPMPPLQAGDLLAVLQAGAYGFAMSSNYNGRLRLPEVLVSGDSFELIRRRQDYEHLLDGCD